MKVLNLKVRAVQGCKEVDLKTEDANLILVGGPNAQGKTSLLNGIKMALMGKRDFPWPERVINDSADKASVEIRLSGDPSMGEDRELKVVLEIDRKRGGEVDTINIFDSAGEKAPSPRALLKDLYQTIAFDPLQFEKLPPKKQREMIAELVGVDLDTPREKYQELYEERRYVNKEVTALLVKEDELTWHEDAPAEPVDTSKLLEELKENQLLRKNQADAASDVIKVEAKIKEHDDEATSQKVLIEQLASQLKFAKAAKKEIEEKRDLVKQELKDLKLALKELPTPADDSEIMSRISDAGTLNDKLQHNERNKELVEQRKKRKEASNDLTDAMKLITEEVEQALWKAEFPVEGMTLDKDGVLLYGRKFADCSRSERIQASAKIGMALNPKLKLLICEDGSDLDVEALEALDTFLKKHNYQALIELVCRSKEDEERCHIVMKNGAPKP